MAQQTATPTHNAPGQLRIDPLQPDDGQEEDFIRTLASLERLQSQLDQVRKIPSNLVQPFHKIQSREQSFKSFTSGTDSSFSAISTLKTDWEEPTTAKLLAQCTKTQDKHVDLVLQHEIGLWGWNEREQALGPKKAPDPPKRSIRNSEEDVKNASDLYGPKFDKFEWKDEKKTELEITVKRPGLWLNFEVKRWNTVHGIVFEVSCLGDLDEQKTISRCMFRREAKEDIFDTLEMILAYGNSLLSRASCDHCGQYRDSKGATPCARRKKINSEAKDSNTEGTASSWVAMHEWCLPNPLPLL